MGQIEDKNPDDGALKGRPAAEGGSALEAARRKKRAKRDQNKSR